MKEIINGSIVSWTAHSLFKISILLQQAIKIAFRNCQALYLKVQNGQRLTLKPISTHSNHHERYQQIDTFLLWCYECYGIDFALINPIPRERQILLNIKHLNIK